MMCRFYILKYLKAWPLLFCGIVLFKQVLYLYAAFCLYLLGALPKTVLRIQYTFNAEIFIILPLT